MKAWAHNTLAIFAALTAVTTSRPVSADTILNGDFSSGLDYWNVSAGEDVITNPIRVSGNMAMNNDNGDIVVSVSNGVAIISQTSDFTVNEIDLYQTFTLPNSPESLQFTIAGLTTDSDSFYPPAGFGASLLDGTTLQSLVATVGPTTDSFFTHDLTAGAAGLAASGVTVTPSLTSDPPLTVSLDLSMLPRQGGGSAEIFFRLLEGGDNLSGTVSISNVEFFAGPNNGGGGGGNPAVPEPGTFGMLLAGMTGLVLAKRRRRRAHSAE